MLHHVSVGVRDVARAAPFYDRVLGALGYRRVMEFLPYGIGYGEDHPEFWVQLPHDRGSASVGNGVHVAFAARDKAVIEAFHRAALAAGGTDDGAPGPRPDYGPHYFGAFVRDLDGNKLEAVLIAFPVAASGTKSKKKRTAKKAKKKGRRETATKRRVAAAGRRRRARTR